MRRLRRRVDEDRTMACCLYGDWQRRAKRRGHYRSLPEIGNFARRDLGFTRTQPIGGSAVVSPSLKPWLWNRVRGLDHMRLRTVLSGADGGCGCFLPHAKALPASALDVTYIPVTPASEDASATFNPLTNGPVVAAIIGLKLFMALAAIRRSGIRSRCWITTRDGNVLASARCYRLAHREFHAAAGDLLYRDGYLLPTLSRNCAATDCVDVGCADWRQAGCGHASQLQDHGEDIEWASARMNILYECTTRKTHEQAPEDGRTNETGNDRDP